MLYGEIQDRDWITYRAGLSWPRRIFGPRRSQFDRVHRACMVVIARKENPSGFLQAHAGDALTADWIDTLIEAVLAAMGITGLQAQMLRAFIRVVLQILLSSLLLAHRECLSHGVFNGQVKSWAIEAASGL